MTDTVRKTHTAYNITKNKQKKNLYHREDSVHEITKYIRKSRSLKRPDENKTEPKHLQDKDVYLDMINEQRRIEQTRRPFSKEAQR
jgi:hypothetical protein